MAIRRVPVEEGQSVWDLALQYYGSTEGLLQLAADNVGVINLETSPEPGSLILIDDSKVINKDVVALLKQKGIRPNNAIEAEGIILPPPPYISAVTSTAILNSIINSGYVGGIGPSLPSSLFSVQAEGLTGSGNITATPSVNLEVKVGGVWISTPFLIPFVDGEVFTGLVYQVRIKAGLVVGTYNETLTLAGAGATDFIMTVEGEVTAPNYFAITVKTDNAGTSASNQFRLPLNPAYSYNCIIEWGDGTSTFQVTHASPTHTYPAPGTYQIKILNNFPAINFASGDDCYKLLSIDNWGDQVWKSFKDAFFGCANLVANYSDVPNTSNVTDFSNAFRSCSVFNGVLNIDTSAAVTLRGMFASCTVFNQPLNSWNTSNVVDISLLFYQAPAFNQPLNSWNTSNVTVMLEIFESATSFNGDISTWDVSNVSDMRYVFYGAVAFNGNISLWNVSSVTDMSYMFYGAQSFNKNIGSWNVSSVTNMSYMLYYCQSFNQNIGAWDVSSVTNMSFMFYSAVSFNKNIGTWDVSSVTNMSAMLCSCLSFNQPLNTWNVSSVTNMSLLFYNAQSFNQNLNSWNVSNVTNMLELFESAIVFNGDITAWDVSNVTDMRYMFYNCQSFNKNIGGWDVSSVTTMAYMFAYCGIDQDISSWDVSNVTSFTEFMLGKSAAGFSAANLDLIYNTWSALTLQPNVNINFNTIKYTAGGSAGKAILTGAPNNWTITDGGI
ncbi:BspA family leucine-rich repeat surface protein [Aurantibacillus circumpalustris]|uniref:BspA family leucine-rich repeat surface protein n=1 Tax=Aurantibacillus circumpalustris TaxID=3036359 RepID=UPI00295C32EC|nr:BspA family leucine-rich repeat surface protein [Aurantibacillus circumpalustris]